MFGDISNINDNTDLIYIITAVVIVNMLVILISRDTKFFGKNVNQWYDKFGITAVVLDVLIIVIGFVITRYIFNIFNIEYSPELFIIILCFICPTSKITGPGSCFRQAQTT
jgi:hypothetical protein